jgi:putative flippase GtrA
VTALTDKNIPEFIRFLFAGGISVCGNVLSRLLFGLYVDYEKAIVMAYGIGMVIAFLFMRKHVFGATGKALTPQLKNFVLINILGLLQTLAISLWFERTVFPALGVVQYTETYSHVIGLSVLAVTSYFGHKLLTFR